MSAPGSGEITFKPAEFQHDGKTIWTLYQCGQCAALVIAESIQEHADWHGKLRQETVMATLGFGGVGL